MYSYIFIYSSDNNYKNASILAFSKMWPFCAFNIITEDIRNFFRIQFIKQNQNCRNLNKILQISGNSESTKEADHILEMPEHGVFCDN